MHTNHRGIIAEQYADLQGIPILEAATKAYPLPKASAESTLRAVFQGAEIGLLNLEDLTIRAAADIESGAFGPASVKMSWIRGFQRLMVQLSLLPHRLALGNGCGQGKGILRIGDSPALRAFARALKVFDRTLRSQLSTSDLSLGSLLSERSLDCSALSVIHMIRVCNQETTIWEYNLAEILVPAPVPDYEQFVVTQGMRNAVYDRLLTGDTFFTQFRGLHQVPEILCGEINDRIECGILSMRAGRLQAAYEHLRCVNVLSGGIAAAMPAIVDNLVTADYHEIRENLGLTSGSHSVGLHFHLFRDLYQQLWEAFAALLPGARANGNGDSSGYESICAALARETECADWDQRAFLLHILGSECLNLRAFVHHWRDEHLNLPRNNLGGNRTKSLTGSLDAIKAVKGMRDAARLKDPMQPLVDVRGPRKGRPAECLLPLTGYFDLLDSLDSEIVRTTGEITQERFRNVQQREGVFALETPFSPPPRRIV